MVDCVVVVLRTNRCPQLAIEPNIQTEISFVPINHYEHVWPL